MSPIPYSAIFLWNMFLKIEQSHVYVYMYVCCVYTYKTAIIEYY